MANDLYERMVRKRMEAYQTTRKVVERAGTAFWDENNADGLRAYQAGARSLQEFILFFKAEAEGND
jgi:hypothetical protein